MNAMGIRIARALPALFFIASAWTQEQPKWWNKSVFYELYVRSFYDGDGNGVGDFKGLTQKLDYLNDGNPATTTDLGVTALWLMPISESPSQHGYDVVDYKSFEKDYGTRADFQELLKQAHARGIKVTIDFVMNHTSRENPWFVQSASGETSPYRNWYIWSKTNPGGPWQQHPDGDWYYALFGYDMPDLNYREPAVKAAMFDNIKFWLDTIKVDGFRLDAVRHLFEGGPKFSNDTANFTFLKEFYSFYKGVSPNAMTVGEIWDTTALTASYIQGGDKLDLDFEFDLSTAVVKAVNAGLAVPIQQTMSLIVKSYPANQYATFLRNHDQPRVLQELGGDLARAKIAAAILLTLPGVPFLYYGEEVGAMGANADEARKPMVWADDAKYGFTTGTPWSAIPTQPAGRSVKAMQADPASLWNVYRKLIQARGTYEALSVGGYKAIANTNASGSLLVFQRGSGQGSVLVVANLGATDVSDYQISWTGSGLTGGSVQARDLLDNQATAAMVVDEEGTIAGWKPLAALKAKTAYVFLLGTPAVAIRPELMSARGHRSGRETHGRYRNAIGRHLNDREAGKPVTAPEFRSR
jgi:alpha-amylase